MSRLLDFSDGFTSESPPSVTSFTAADVANVPSGSLASTNVQDALNELQNDINTRVASAIVTTKGDLLAATGSGTLARLGVGTNGYVLLADSAEATGIKWSAPTANGSSGYIQFNSSGLLSSSSNLYWDIAGSNLGIGTTSPIRGVHIANNEFIIEQTTGLADYKKWNFYVSGGASNKQDLNIRLLNDAGTATSLHAMTILGASGNIGIGTSSPVSKLQIGGGSSGSDATYSGLVQFNENPSSLEATGGLEFKTSTFGSGYGWKMASIDSSGVHLAIGTRQNSATWSEKVRIDSSGNVGIGTASPITKLTVYDASNSVAYITGDSTVSLYTNRSSTDATSSNYIFRKTRGTDASPTAVATSDTIGQTLYQVYGGTNYRNIAAIVGTVDTYTSDTNISSRLSFWTSPAGSTSTTERLRIQSSGDIRFIALSASTIPVNTTSAMGYYQTGTKFVIWYNDAGTMRYKYLDMSGTGVTWVHTTTAP